MEPLKQKLTCIDLHDVFPSNTGIQNRRIQIAPLGNPLENNVLLHEQSSNTLLNIDYETGDIRRFEFGTFLENTTSKFASHFRASQGNFRMNTECSQSPDGMTLFYKVRELANRLKKQNEILIFLLAMVILDTDVMCNIIRLAR